MCAPTVTRSPRGRLQIYKRIRHDERFVGLERRAVEAFRLLDVMMTDTCINYQVFMPPVFGEHVAFGDTGSSIYTNSVLGARTNFEGGPSALAAALTAETPRYGYPLDERRRGTTLFTFPRSQRATAIGELSADWWDGRCNPIGKPRLSMGSN